MSSSRSFIRSNPVFRDPRLFQITALSSFLSYGILVLGWNFQMDRIVTTLLFGLLTQFAAIFLLRLPLDSWKSGLITALGLSLLFRSSEPMLWAAAPVLGIASKYIFRSHGKHIFNPANFGVILPIILFGDAWISPGQWGSGGMLIFFFGAAALMVLMKVGRIDTSLTFLATIFALEFFRSVVYLGWEFDWLLHKMGNGSLLLFAFFMITDPRTTPNDKTARLLWAAGIGCASFIMSSWFYLHTAPMWTLFFAAPVMFLFDRIWKANAFQWKNSGAEASHVTRSNQISQSL